MELWWPDAGIYLRGVDPDVAKQRAHLFEIVALLEHLDRHAVPQVVRLELGATHQFAVDLAQPPDVLAGHRLPDAADRPLALARLEQGRVWGEPLALLREHALDVESQELELDIPLAVTAAMRNPALTSADGPGNLLAAVRVVCDPWVRTNARALGVMAVMLDEVYAAADVLKIHPTRLNAFASVQTGPLAALVEDRVVPMALPVRDGVNYARAQLQSAAKGRAAPVALLWMALDESGGLIEAILGTPDWLGYRGIVVAAMGGGTCQSA